MVVGVLCFSLPVFGGGGVGGGGGGYVVCIWEGGVKGERPRGAPGGGGGGGARTKARL